MEVNSKTRNIYVKRKKTNFFKSNNSFKDNSMIKEFFKSYLLYNDEDKLKSIFIPKNYILIYNYLFLSTNSEKYIEIYSFINEQLINAINQKFSSEENNQNKIDKTINIFNYIDILDKKIKNIKNILTTCESRFNAELIKWMNNKINIFSILKEIKYDFNKFIEESEKIFLDYFIKDNIDEKEKKRIINSIYQFIKIVKLVSDQKRIEVFYEKILEQLIRRGKYNEIYETTSNKINLINDSNNIEVDLISNYFDSINKEIESDYIFLNQIFGKKEANKFKDKIIKIYIFEKFIKQIFKNENLLKRTLLEKKYDILKFIESKTRHSLKLTKEYVDSVFDLLLKEYQDKIVVPKDIRNIPKGLLFVKEMLSKIKELNIIFKEVFNQNRKVNLKFNETLIKLISSKNIEPLEYFLAIYVNENIYNEEIRNSLLLDKSFIQLITNRNNKEIFFNFYKKYIIKRISSNNFNLDIELAFEKFLKNNIENRYMIQISRLFKDIEENKFINNNNTQDYFYLFSYEALDNQYDLLEIIDSSKENKDFNPFKSSMFIYNENFPRRKISLSQILSSIELCFLNKYNLLLNYVQWYILQVILKEKKNNYSITYEKLSSLIPYKSQNKIYLKVYINSLIELKILIKKSKNLDNNDLNLDDNLMINFNFEIPDNKNIINCFNKPNSIVKGMINKMNNLERDKNEKEKDDYNRNYKVIAIKENARFIIDCVIMQITKSLPNGETISEKDLIITILKHKLISDLNLNKYKLVDTSFIKQRISNLVEREYIKFHESENQISYSYC